MNGEVDCQHVEGRRCRHPKCQGYDKGRRAHDLTCGRCLATITSSKQAGETVHCSECSYTLTVEA